MSTRDQILDSFETLIIDQGERSATLSAVAKAAGVSKGGLLYHFDSKQALARGLAERIEEFSHVETQRLRASEDPARQYLEESITLAEPIDRTFVALGGLALLDDYEVARSALSDADDRILTLFTELLGDRSIALLVVRLSDSFYQRAGVGIESSNEVADLESIMCLVDRLRRTSAEG